MFREKRQKEKKITCRQICKEKKTFFWISSSRRCSEPLFNVFSQGFFFRKKKFFCWKTITKACFALRAEQIWLGWYKFHSFFFCSLGFALLFWFHFSGLFWDLNSQDDVTAYLILQFKVLLMAVMLRKTCFFCCFLGLLKWQLKCKIQP